MGMIKSDKELTVSKNKVLEMNQSLLDAKTNSTLPVKFQKVAFAGLESFKLQIEEEIAEYENIKKGKIPKYFFQIDNLGLLLIALRIKNGLTQTQLAEKLEVSPSQVSRDENNDYHGVSMVTVKKILKALGEDLEIKIK